MTSQRINDLISLVLEARDKNGISISISIEKLYEEIHVFTVKPSNGIDSTFYTTSEFYKAEDKQVIRHGDILHIYDPNLTEAEKHIRRLLK